jgi:large subunit ribosomal protein L9
MIYLRYMKVILTQDVPKIGNKDDVKDFPDGFAQNVLLSKGKAILATPKALADLETRRANKKRKKEEDLKIFSEMIKTLNDQKIIVKVKTNEKGKLFKSVNEKDVSVSIKDSTGLDFNPENIIMDHIKEIGLHKIILKNGELEGKCEVSVESV